MIYKKVCKLLCDIHQFIEDRFYGNCLKSCKGISADNWEKNLRVRDLATKEIGKFYKENPLFIEIIEGLEDMQKELTLTNHIDRPVPKEYEALIIDIEKRLDKIISKESG